MRIIHSRGFPEEERHQTRAIIYSNLVIAFKVLLDIMNAEDIDFENGEKIKVLPTLFLMRPTSANPRLKAICGPIRQYGPRCRVRRSVLRSRGSRCNEGHVEG